MSFEKMLADGVASLLSSAKLVKDVVGDVWFDSDATAEGAPCISARRSFDDVHMTFVFYDTVRVIVQRDEYIGEGHYDLKDVREEDLGLTVKGASIGPMFAAILAFLAGEWDCNKAQYEVHLFVSLRVPIFAASVADAEILARALDWPEMFSESTYAVIESAHASIRKTHAQIATEAKK